MHYMPLHAGQDGNDDDSSRRDDLSPTSMHHRIITHWQARAVTVTQAASANWELLNLLSHAKICL